jgi:hypothetical protein
MKAVVASAMPDGEAVFTEEMLRFARHYGFQPKACRPYRAKTKGKIERSVSYLRHNFFYGRQFRDLADLNKQLGLWLEQTANSRIHGTTHEIPKIRLQQEAAHLKPLNADFFMPVVNLSRRVTHDGYVAYNGNDYSLPEGVIRAPVEIRASPTHIELYQQGKLLATHRVLPGRGERILIQGHRHPSSEMQKYKRMDNWENDFVKVERRSLEIYEEALR